MLHRGDIFTVCLSITGQIQDSTSGGQVAGEATGWARAFINASKTQEVGVEFCHSLLQLFEVGPVKPDPVRSSRPLCVCQLLPRELVSRHRAPRLSTTIANRQQKVPPLSSSTASSTNCQPQPHQTTPAMRLHLPLLLTSLASTCTADYMRAFRPTASVCLWRLNQSQFQTDYGTYVVDASDGCRTSGVPAMVEFCVDWPRARGHFRFNGQGKRCMRWTSTSTYPCGTFLGDYTEVSMWTEVACTW